MLTEKTRLKSAQLVALTSRYKYRILLGSLLAILLSLIAFPLRVSEYVANTSFMLQSAPDNATQADSAAEVSAKRFNRQETMTAAIEILSSRYLKEQVIKALGPEILYPEVQRETANKFLSEARDALQNVLRLVGISPTLNVPSTHREEALSRFKDALSIHAEKNSHVIRLYFRDEDPEKAVNVLKVLLTVFTQRYAELHKRTDVDLMTQTLSEYRRALDEAEGAIQALSEEFALFDPKEQVQLLLKRRDQLDGASDKTDTYIKKTEQEIASFKRTLRRLPSTVILHTDVQETDVFERSIRPRKPYLNKMVRTGRNDEYQALDLEMRRLNARLEGLLAESDELAVQRRQVASELPKVTLGKMKLDRLGRELRVRERSYETFFAKLEEEKIQESLNSSRTGSIRVLQPPAATRGKPLFGMGIATKVLVAGLLGLIVSFLVALIYAYRSIGRRATTQDSVEQRFGVPVLATMPEKMSAKHLSSRAS